jgi:hypothetical protein
MSPAAHPRPVSGEIVTCGATIPAFPPRIHGEDVHDAEFEVVGIASRPHEAVATAAEASAPGLDMLRHRAHPTRGQRAGPLFWIVGVSLAAAAFWISGGHRLVDLDAPGGAAKPAGLRIVDVGSRIEGPEGARVLHVEGVVRNDGTEVADVPTMRIAVGGSGGDVASYLLGTTGERLAPGARHVFSSRLVAPRSEIGEIAVSFVE